MYVSPPQLTPRPLRGSTGTARRAGAITGVVVSIIAASLAAPTALAAEVAPGLFSTSVTPTVKAVQSKKTAEIGVRITATSDGTISALQIYRSKRQRNKQLVGSLWTSSGDRIARATFASSSRVGWQNAKLKTPVAVKAGEVFTVSYLAKGGHYPATPGMFSRNYRHGGLMVAQNGSVRTYTSRSRMPSGSVARGRSFLVDVAFTPTGGSTVAAEPTPTPTPVVTPTPTPTPVVTPTPTPSSPTASQTPTAPAAGSGGIPAGFPNANTTGVRAGVTLTDSGSITVNTSGTVIEGLRVNGTITVNAANVVIRDTLIRGGGNGYPIRLTDGAQNVLIEYVEVDNLDSTGIGIYFNGGSGRVRYTDIHSAEDGIRLGGAGDIIVEYSYIHDLFRQPDGHHDTIQIRSGDNVTIRGNSLLPYVATTKDPMNAAIQVGSLTGSPLRNFTVTGNYMDGGNFTINGGDSSNIASGSFTRNAFGTHYRYGVRTALGSATWSGNTWASTGAIIP